LPYSPWLALSADNQETFPDGAGYEINNFIPRNSFNLNDEWVPFSSQYQGDNNANACNPPQDLVQHAADLVSFSMDTKVLISQDFCLEQLRFGAMGDRQAKGIVENLMNQSRYVWTRRYQLEALKYATKAVVTENGLVYSTGETIPAVEPFGKLNSNVTDEIYRKLQFDGGVKYAYAMSEGQPVFALILDSIADREMMKGDEATRQDFRWAESGAGLMSKLLEPLGAKKTYGGFFHLSDGIALRYNWDGAQLVEVPPYLTNTAATQGTKSIENPAYATAQYTVSFAYTKGGITNMHPAMPKSYEGMRFGKQTYAGEWEWLNIREKYCNPFENTGNWISKFVHGTRQNDPRLLYAIVHQICPNDFGLTGCVYSG
jgi:hypothetical protein